MAVGGSASGAGAVAGSASSGLSVPRIARVPFDAPWTWLAAGWRDMWTRPELSLLYGAVFAAAAMLLTVGLLQQNLQALILVLAGGFMLVGPLLAVGLYELSRRLEAGEPVDPRDIMFVGTRSPGQLAFMGALLLIAYMAWLEIGLVLFVMFMGAGALPPLEQLVPTLLFTPRGLGLLIVGTMAGAVLAALVYAATAVSIPFLMSRRVDVVTAIMTSFMAIERNLRPMLLWAVLIAGMMSLGIATLFVGLIFVFPLIGHATWHAYRQIVQLDPEPEIVPDVTSR